MSAMRTTGTTTELRCGGRGNTRWLLAGLMASAGLACASPMALAQGPGGDPVDIDLFERAEPEQSDGASFPIGGAMLVYITPMPGAPSIEDLMQVEFELLQTAQGYVAPRPGLPTVTLTFAELANQPERAFYTSALLEMSGALVSEFNRGGIIGVFVAPLEVNLSTGGDRRGEGETNLTFEIYTARVSIVRTIARGQRIAEADRINAPEHRRIRENSPVRPAEDGGEDLSLLRRDVLDDYVLRLNRHPGRRVDVSVEPTTEEGEAVLDYQVYESKPWSLYFQLSNTGTENTDEWRERFGLIHNQLTGNDDILTIDYITAGFDESHAVLGSYEFPFPGNDLIRVKVFGQWNEFTASDVGLSGERFTGEGWSFGADVSANIYQDQNFFVDVIGGARVQHVEITNELVAVEGDETFYLVHLGIEAEQFHETSSFAAGVDLEFGFGGDESELEKLGRLFPDEEWAVLTFNGEYSFFIEPLVNGDAWLDPTTPESSTLAHEIAVSVKGQYAFNFRLIPNLETVTGGAYTVRGYPESVVASDSAVVFSAEYRFHVPRSFAIDEDPRELWGRPFKYAPQQVYGRPDWDLVLKAFLDVGTTFNSDSLSFEDDETLIGAGVGTELIFRRNVTASLDWGFALTDIDGEVDSGDNELHFILTLLY